MDDQKSLTLHWRLCLKGSSDIITNMFADNDGQYFDHGIVRLCSYLNIQDVTPQKHRQTIDAHC